MSYDLSNTTASNGKPKGRYTLRVTSAKIVKTKKNEDMFAVEFVITGEDFNKFKIGDSFMLQGNAAKFTMPKLAYLMDMVGVPRTAVSDSAIWLGKHVEAEIGQDKEGYNKAKEYFQAPTQTGPGY